MDTTSPTHGGNSTFSIGASWSSSSNDLCFYVYGDIPGTVVTPSVASIAFSIGAVAVIASQILSLSPISATFDTPAPSVSIAGVGAKPIGLLLALTQQTGAATITHSALSATFEVQSLTVVTNQNLVVGVQSATFNIPAPDVYSPVLLFPDAQELTFTLNPTTVDVIQSTVVEVSVQTATLSLPTAQVNHNAVAIAGVQSLAFSVPEVTLIVQTNALVEATVISGSFSVQTPNVVTSQVLQVGIQTATFSIPGSTVVISYTNAPAVQSLAFTTNAVSFITHNRLSIAAQTLTFSIPTLTRTGGFYSDKYQDRNSSYGDKYTTRNTTYSNKLSARNTSYDDKYTPLNL